MKIKEVIYRWVAEYDPIALNQLRGRLFVEVYVDQKKRFYREYEYSVVPPHPGTIPSRIARNIRRQAEFVQMAQGTEFFKMWVRYSYQRELP